MSTKLPKGKPVVLQADDSEQQRGLIVKWRDGGGYDVYYWYDTPSNIVSAELKGDGESFGQVKRVELGFHPELDEKSVSGESKATVNEINKTTLDRAGKLLTYLVKYYGLKISSARQAVVDLARFL